MHWPATRANLDNLIPEPPMTRILAFVVLAAALPALPQAPGKPARSVDELKTFDAQSCVRCHGADGSATDGVSAGGGVSVGGSVVVEGGAEGSSARGGVSAGGFSSAGFSRAGFSRAGAAGVGSSSRIRAKTAAAVFSAARLASTGSVAETPWMSSLARNKLPKNVKKLNWCCFMGMAGSMSGELVTRPVQPVVAPKF